MIIIIIILFIAYFFILVSNQKNIETFISISNSLMHSKSPNIFKSILYLDKKIDNIEANIKNIKKDEQIVRLQKMDKKYQWMKDYHSSLTDPNSKARQRANAAMTRKMQNEIKNGEKNAIADFMKKQKAQFLNTLKKGGIPAPAEISAKGAAMISKMKSNPAGKKDNVLSSMNSTAKSKKERKDIGDATKDSYDGNLPTEKDNSSEGPDISDNAFGAAYA
jgi:hypothetical protein